MAIRVHTPTGRQHDHADAATAARYDDYLRVTGHTGQLLAEYPPGHWSAWEHVPDHSPVDAAVNEEAARIAVATGVAQDRWCRFTRADLVAAHQLGTYETEARVKDALAQVGQSLGVALAGIGSHLAVVDTTAPDETPGDPTTTAPITPVEP